MADAPDTEEAIGADELAWLRTQWRLDPARAFTNHGSFGAMPVPVVDRVRELTDLVAANPNRFFSKLARPMVGEAAADVARFLRGDESGLAFVINATAAASVIAAALRLEPGDEVVVSNHGYGAVRMGLQRYSDDVGAVLREVDLPLDPSTDEIVTLVDAVTTPRTRLVLLDQITSPTARLFDVATIAGRLRRDGELLVAVDGAHSPGTLDVDLRSLCDSGVDLWFGNLHKWVCAPPGAAVLYALPHVRERLRPLVVSWAEGEGYPESLRMQGTVNLTSWLAAPSAIAFHEAVGYDRVRAYGAATARAGAETVAAGLGLEPVPGPGLPMQLVPLGHHPHPDLQRVLEEADPPLEYAITAFGGRAYARVAAHLYNRSDDYAVLATALSSAVERLSSATPMRASAMP